MLTKRELTGATARRERSRQEMRMAVLEAAGKIVESEGIQGLTIRAVAQAIGYSPGAIYEYYDSKEAILTALYFGGTDGLGAHCERAVRMLPAEANAIDAFSALGHAYREFALNHPDLYRLVFGGFTTPPQAPPLDCDEDVEADGFGILAEMARQGVAAGLLVDVPPAVVACTAWAAVHGFVSLEITGHLTGGNGPAMPPDSPEAGRLQRDNMFDALLRMVMFGFVREHHQLRAGSSNQ